LASILVLLSSSVMDDGPRAKSRFDYSNKTQKHGPAMNMKIRHAEINSGPAHKEEEKKKDGQEKKGKFGPSWAGVSPEINPSSPFCRKWRCHPERDGIHRATQLCPSRHIFPPAFPVL
jgi:hypothetical protein